MNWLMRARFRGFVNLPGKNIFMIHDPLANMLISLKNAALVKIPAVEVPFSNLKLSVAEVLLAEGYLTRVVRKGKKIKKFLELALA